MIVPHRNTVRIALGYDKPPHKDCAAFYDAGYWCEATGLLAPPASGMLGTAAIS